MRLDHVTLRTADLDVTRTFLQDLLGLAVGYRPNFGFPGYWLYHGDEPIVHLIPGDATSSGRIGEMIDHVAFRLEGYASFRQGSTERAFPIRRWIFRIWASDASLSGHRAAYSLNSSFERPDPIPE